MPLRPTWAQCCCPRRHRSVCSSCLLYRSLRCEQPFHRGSELLFQVRLGKEVRAFDKLSFHFVGSRTACRVEHAHFRSKLDGLKCKVEPIERPCLETNIGKKCSNRLRRAQEQKRLVYIAS